MGSGATLTWSVDQDNESKFEKFEHSEEALRHAERARRAVLMFHRCGTWVDILPAPAHYTRARWEVMREHFGDVLTEEQWEELEMMWGATRGLIVEGPKAETQPDGQILGDPHKPLRIKVDTTETPSVRIKVDTTEAVAAVEDLKQKLSGLIRDSHRRHGLIRR